MPAETIHEEDWSLTGGAKGKVLDDVRWDLSLTYGSDKIDVGLDQSANVSLFNDTLTAFGAGWTPRQFYIGQYLHTLRTINLDLGKEVAPSFLPAPVNISIGAENRHETYGVRCGDFVQRYLPEFEKRWNRFARRVGGSWRVDETYVKIKGRGVYLYRAVDKVGKTVNFSLRAKRDVAAAKGFFRRAFAYHGGPPRKITLDGYQASHRAARELLEQTRGEFNLRNT